MAMEKPWWNFLGDVRKSFAHCATRAPMICTVTTYMMHGEHLGLSRFKWCGEKQTAHCSNFSENSSVLVFGWPILRLRSSAYLIFVIFFTLADFEAWKFYTQKCINLRQNSVNYTLCVNLHTVYMKLHSVCKITHCMSNYTLCVKLHTV